MQRADVVVVGAGPAGLVLAHRLHQAGLGTVVLESRSRAYVEGRVRAGVLEAPTVALLEEMGVADRLHAEGLIHDGVLLQWEGERHRIDLAALAGAAVTVYGQQEIVHDLVAARVAAGGDLRFEAEVTGVGGTMGASPSRGDAGVVVSYRDAGGDRHDVRCDVVAGCDGSHGASRTWIPPAALQVMERDHPYAWLGILADVAPSTDQLIYAFHERGFALHSMRSPSVSRLYLQVAPDERLEEWPDDRIWAELQRRLALDGWTLQEGPVREKGITPMRSLVAAPMRHGQLFLAGDAAHIVPPTGAKGLNLAVADAKVLGDALVAWYRSGDQTGLDSYSDRCLERVWRV
ncbi:MAG TPA: 4-hydroxybenzoate 3-monooxygenase, partial [Acidimicrobiales bacterium]|nr:4-hydroxybenzoate 3-monooxygenase [Acidimicrobiales bacterium]